jgi:hypothetical protein
MPNNASPLPCLFPSHATQSLGSNFIQKEKEMEKLLFPFAVRGKKRDCLSLAYASLPHRTRGKRKEGREREEQVEIRDLSLGFEE